MGQFVKYLFALLMFNTALTVQVSAQDQAPDPYSDVVYKIQIRAQYRTPLNVDSINKMYELDMPVEEYYHNRYYKYTIYAFNNLLHAIDSLFLVIDQYNIKDAFLVKFKGGQRVDFDSNHEYLKVLQKSLQEENAGRLDSTQTSDSDTARIISELSSRAIYFDSGIIRPILVPENDGSQSGLAQLKKQKQDLFSGLEIWLSKKFSSTVAEIVHYILYLTYNHWILLLVLLLILYFILFALVLIVVIISSRIWDTYNKSVRERLKNKYHDIIADYLFKEENENIVPSILFKQRTRFRKNILVDVMIDLFNNLEGDISKKLRALYINLRLDRVSISKIKSGRWNVKARGFHELASMDAEDAEKYIKNYLNTRNDELRSQAYIAFVQLNKDNPFGFLGLVETYFTTWEQLNVYAVARKKNAQIPDFSKWMQSGNDTVVSFALKMAIIFKQLATSKEIRPLIAHPNPAIRNLAFQAVGELNLFDFIEDLMKRFPSEPIKNKVEIIKALGRMPDEVQLSFYEKVLTGDKDFKIRLAAAGNLHKMGPSGQELLLVMKDRLAPELDDIYLHVNDERI